MLSKILPFLFLSVLLILVLPFTVLPVHSGVTSFFWLKPGTEALYMLPEGPAIFDDYANGNPFRGNYSWRCLGVNDTHAVLDVEVNLELFKRPEWQAPAHINYIGTEFLERAARGDLSFIRRIPMDQVIGRLELYNSSIPPGVPDGVGIPSPVVISKRFTVTVDLDTMAMIDEEGESWGRWILWIDPLQYTLEGWQHPQVETFIMNWLSTTVNANVFYVPETDNMPINTIFGVRNRWFYAGVNDILTNDLLTELGWSGISLAWAYEARTGLLLTARTSDFIDDFLGQRLGLVALHTQTKNYLNLTNVRFGRDLNGDWQVNISDITIVAIAFKSKPNEQRWNQLADVNKDGVINIVDISIVAKVFGTQYITAD